MSHNMNRNLLEEEKLITSKIIGEISYFMPLYV